MYSGKMERVVYLLVPMGIFLLSLTCDAAKRRFTVADDVGLTHFGDPYGGQADPVTFSPDGRYFVVDSERGMLHLNRSESTLRVFRTDDVREYLRHSEITREPPPIWMLSKSTYKNGPIITKIRWLADSSGLAFLVKTSSGSEQLFLANIKAKT